MRYDFIFLLTLVIIEFFMFVLFAFLTIMQCFSVLIKFNEESEYTKVDVKTISKKKIIRMLTGLIVFNISVYSIVHAIMFWKTEFAPGIGYISTVLGNITIPYLLTIPINKKVEIPYFLFLRRISVEPKNTSQLFLNSLEEYYETIKQIDANELQEVIEEIKTLIKDFNKFDDYQILIELIRFVIDEKENCKKELCAELNRNILNNSIKISQKINALESIINTSLPIEYFVDIFIEIKRNLFIQQNGDLPVHMLVKNYCEVVLLAIKEPTYLPQVKKEIVHDYILIFADFNSIYLVNKPSNEIIQALCDQHSILRPQIKEYLPIKKTGSESIFDDAKRGINQFTRRHVIDNFPDQYKIEDWCDDLAEEEN